MNELGDFLNVLAEGKKQKAEKVVKATEQLGDFLGVIAQAKAQDPKHQMLKQVKQHVRENISELFDQLGSAKADVITSKPIVESAELDVITSNVVGEFLYENGKFIDPQTLNEIVVPEVKPAAEIYTKAEIDDLLKHNASFQQPNPAKVDPNFRAVQDKIKFLEQWLGKITAHGPGSGEVNLRWLDDVARETISDGRWLKYDDSRKKFVFDEINPNQVVNNTTEVTSNYYEVQEDDYYIGVNNAAAPVTIVLPETTNSGRTIIIKDEDGDAEIHPITVQGLVDNDPEGFIIQINNGAVQLIYRAGCWRIV